MTSLNTLYREVVVLFVSLCTKLLHLPVTLRTHSPRDDILQSRLLYKAYKQFKGRQCTKIDHDSIEVRRFGPPFQAQGSGLVRKPQL